MLWPISIHVRCACPVYRDRSGFSSSPFGYNTFGAMLCCKAHWWLVVDKKKLYILWRYRRMKTLLLVELAEFFSAALLLCNLLVESMQSRDRRFGVSMRTSKEKQKHLHANLIYVCSMKWILSFLSNNDKETENYLFIYARTESNRTIY